MRHGENLCVILCAQAPDGGKGLSDHETRRPQSKRERLRAKRARPTNEAAPQKGRPSQKKGKEKENVFTAKPSGMWTRDEASEAARAANPASEASRPVIYAFCSSHRSKAASSTMLISCISSSKSLYKQMVPSCL